MPTFSFNVKLTEEPQRRKPEDTWQEMMDQANAFFQAGSRCDANLSLSPEITNSLTAPAVVCYAFSAEIYLKLLLRKDGVKPPREHHLAKLFTLLSKEKQASISTQAQLSIEETIQILEGTGDAFEKWRYSFENGLMAISVTQLTVIARALHKTIREVFPNIGVTFENRLAI